MRTYKRFSVETFADYVDTSGDCWPWLASTNKGGYGVLELYGKRLYAHRVTYELMVAPIPDGLVIDHLCCNPPCCNPAHLEVVTAAENTRRWGINIAHCRRGHVRTPENTFVNRRGCKSCRVCRRELRRKGPRAAPPARTHCVNGHPWTNPYIDARGRKHCRACKQDAKRRYRRRLKAEAAS